jgi:hypothetical protein
VFPYPFPPPPTPPTSPVSLSPSGRIAPTSSESRGGGGKASSEHLPKDLPRVRADFSQHRALPRTVVEALGKARGAFNSFERSFRLVPEVGVRPSLPSRMLVAMTVDAKLRPTARVRYFPKRFHAYFHVSRGMMRY